ncbi:MAG: thermonuclease family protein [Cyanobacteriota bacterium]
MKTSARIIIAITFIAALFAAKILYTSTYSPYPDTVYVQRVVDGDTFIDKKRNRYRLIGVDTPELKRDNNPEEPFAKEATEYTTKLIEHKRVKLKFDQKKLDKYNRYLVYVYTPDGKMLNELLLENGYAEVYKNDSYKFKKKFFIIENKAKKNKLRLWNQ